MNIIFKGHFPLISLINIGAISNMKSVLELLGTGFSIFRGNIKVN